MSGKGITELKIQRLEQDVLYPVTDHLAIEEPLEISVNYGPDGARINRRISVTMRTPGNDAELAAGFLFTEGLISHASDISGITFPGSLPGMESNRIQLNLREDLEFDPVSLDRNFYTTSSCGVCGKASIEAIKTTITLSVNKNMFPVDPKVIESLPEKLRAAQVNFENTGGIHASALFDIEGNLLALREDVGRHNALDKLIGFSMNQGWTPLQQHMLLLSGRASFELIQKAAMAGIGVVCAIGAPSSLAVQTASEMGITLIGFLRRDRFNIYTQFHEIHNL